MAWRTRSANVSPTVGSPLTTRDTVRSATPGLPGDVDHRGPPLTGNSRLADLAGPGTPHPFYSSGSRRSRRSRPRSFCYLGGLDTLCGNRTVTPEITLSQDAPSGKHPHADALHPMPDRKADDVPTMSCRGCGRRACCSWRHARVRPRSLRVVLSPRRASASQSDADLHDLPHSRPDRELLVEVDRRRRAGGARRHDQAGRGPDHRPRHATPRRCCSRGSSPTCSSRSRRRCTPRPAC